MPLKFKSGMGAILGKLFGIKVSAMKLERPAGSG